MSLTVNSNTNQYTTSGYGYDPNGNVTSLPQSSGNLILGYDVENRQTINVDGVSGYDMENEPLLVAGSGIWPVYDLSGRRLRHESVGFGYNVQAPEFDTINYTINDRNIYFGGRMIQSNSKTVLVDRTGSVRADETGATFEYLPYGEEFTLTAQDREKFATYTRSSVTGLDFAQQRWYDSVHGGFITPDRARRGISTRTPLSWNAYAYVQGDPINLNDPTGRFDDIPGDFCDLDPLDPSCMCLGDDLLDRDCLDEQGGDTGVPEGRGQRRIRRRIAGTCWKMRAFSPHRKQM